MSRKTVPLSFNTDPCSEASVGWQITNRAYPGTYANGQTWITPIQFTSHGVVSEWRYWAGRKLPFRAMVLRNATSDWTSFNIVGINDIPKAEATGKVSYVVPDNERIVVREDDVIGYGWEGYPVVEHGNAADEQLPLKYFTDFEINAAKVNDLLSPPKTSTRVHSIQAVVAGK